MKIGERMTDEPLFYIVLIGLIIIVFAQILNKNAKQSPKQNNQSLEEFEQTIELFASDLEEQNEALVHLFKDTKRDYEFHLAKQTGKIEFLEKQTLDMAQEMTYLKVTLNELQQNVRPSQSEVIIEQDTSRQANKEITNVSDELMNRQVNQETVQEETAEDVPTILPTLKNRYEELFSMYENGKSIEYIAKKLGKNKGEISLILMLSKQEEAPQ